MLHKKISSKPCPLSFAVLLSRKQWYNKTPNPESLSWGLNIFGLRITDGHSKESWYFNKNKKGKLQSFNQESYIIVMFNYGWQKSTEESQTLPIKLYSRKTSESWIDEDEERNLWHEQFPKFTFLKQLSVTESSSVWLVMDLEDQREYAGKIIPRMEKENLSSSHQIEELEFLRQIQLPSAVITYQITSSNDFYLILMQYHKQGDLASYTQNYAQNNMPKYSKEHLDWVRFCFGQIVRGVSELHQKGYVHRDLKPSNFLIDQGKLKLNDFGLVIKKNTIDPSYCGTPSYMAPERLDSKKSKLPICPSSDMWSLGVVLYELITGDMPYEQTDRQQLLQQIYGNCISFDGQFPSDLKTLILNLLQINPLKRTCMEQLLKHPYLLQ